MYFNNQTVATCSIVIIGALIAAPVFVKGLSRRGTGVKYESNFLIQRAPQLAILFNLLVMVPSFFVYIGLLNNIPGIVPFLALTAGQPQGVTSVISWCGVLVLISGMIFMVGGWYSLGDCFSTDAEVLEGQTVRNTGLLKYVMHPVYSGIIQCLFGASLAATSLPSALIALFVVAPFWLRRAKYEENLLMENLGPSYREYAESMHWRRLVPRFFPIGV